jgi:hypothetical protein
MRMLGGLLMAYANSTIAVAMAAVLKTIVLLNALTRVVLFMLFFF